MAARSRRARFVTAVTYADSGPVPTIAGRSPSYIVRQLYDMQRGNRNGAWTSLMAPVVAHIGPGRHVDRGRLPCLAATVGPGGTEATYLGCP